MIAQTSFNNSEVKLTSNGVPIPEPISFGFDEIIKAKAEADAAIRAEIERHLSERASGAHRQSTAPENAETESPKDSSTMYRYDMVNEDSSSEFSELKRKKSRK